MSIKLPPRKTTVTIVIEDGNRDGTIRTSIEFQPSLDPKRPITTAVEVAMDAMQYAMKKRAELLQVKQVKTPKRNVKK